MTKQERLKNGAKSIADVVVAVTDIAADAAPFFTVPPNKLFIMIATERLNSHGWYATTIGGKKVFFEKA